MAAKSGKKRFRGVRIAIRILFLLMLSVVFGVGAWFYARYGAGLERLQKEARRIVAESSDETFRQSETSLVYDANGMLISSLKGEKDVYYIELKDIPSDVVEAMISIEDKKFYQHPGIDFKAIIRAAWALVENKGEITQGASTITQQLARNIFLTHEESWERKVKEIFLALELEKKYSKTKIMEFYLNNIYFANGYYGIQAASYGYFGRSVQELTLSEQAFLCAIPNSPNRYDPYRNMENTLARRDRILGQMELDGKLSDEEAEAAKLEQPELIQIEREKNNYVETYAYECAIRELMKAAGFQFRSEYASEEEEERYRASYDQLYDECQLSLYTGGYRIYTSLNLEIQEQLQASVDAALSVDQEQNAEGVYALQGAAVTIDNDDGKVVAIVGGRDQALPGYTLNRAYQSYRQPGSSIKPLIVYTPAFEVGYRPEDLVLDQKEEEGPRNVDGIYEGEIPILRAVAVSKNTVAWKLFEELTVEKGLSYLLDMNFSRIVADDYYPAASLGGLTYGVSALEMTAAFATLEQEGIYREPTCIRMITDADGTVLVSEPRIEEKRVYQEAAVEKMNRCLLEVMTTGTGRRGAINMPSAGKTGTTNQQRDKWYVGFTAYYTTGVWVGYDMPRSLEHLSLDTEPLMIWKDFMGALHQGKDWAGIPAYVIPEPEPEPEEEIPSEEETPPEEEVPSEDEPEQEEPSEEELPEEELPEETPEEEDVPPEDGTSPEEQPPESVEPPEELPPSEQAPEEMEPPDEFPEDDFGEFPEEEPEQEESGTTSPQNPVIGPEELSPEDYEFFYGDES